MVPIYNQIGKINWDIPAPPLGLLYLAGMLEKEGLEVNMVDAFDVPFDKIEEIIIKEKPGIVGVSCFTDSRLAALKVVDLVKKVNPKIYTVMGGSHASSFPEQILRHYPNVDFIVRGEAEYTLVDLVKALEGKKALNTIDGLALRHEGKIVLTPERKKIQNLDEIPFPAHHLVDQSKYIPSGADPNGWKASSKRYTTMMTSRGCPYLCTYCSTTVYWGQNFRGRSPMNVVDELEEIHNVYGIEVIGFFDDIFTARMDRITEICKEIVKRNIKIQFSCGTRVNFIKPEMLEWMKRAGCQSIFFGVESCSQKILNNIKKFAKVEQVINAFKSCDEFGIHPSMALMVGNPGEDKETIKETIEVMKRVKPYGMNIGILSIFPDTEIYELAKSQNFISDDHWLTDKASPLYTVENSLSTLRNYRLKIELNYHWLQRDYVQVVLAVINRYKVLKLAFDALMKARKLVGIKSFGIWKMLYNRKRNKHAYTQDTVAQLKT